MTYIQIYVCIQYIIQAVNNVLYFFFVTLKIFFIKLTFTLIALNVHTLLLKHVSICLLLFTANYD